MDNVNASIIDAYLDELDRQTAAHEAQRVAAAILYTRWLAAYWRGEISLEEWLEFYEVWPDAIETEQEVYT